MSENLRRRLESLRQEKAAKEKSIERYRVRKDHRMANDLAEYVKKLDKSIAKIEAEIAEEENGAKS
jgi:hypothetical protein